MPSVEAKIWRAIRARINSIPLPYDKAWPAEPYEPPYIGGQLSPYLRIGRVTVDPLPVFIGSGKKHERTGTLIVTLVHPLLAVADGHEGTYTDTYDDYAGRIAQHFADGTEMRYDNVCVRVSSQPHVQPGFEDNAYWQVPVSIPWRTFA